MVSPTNTRLLWCAYALCILGLGFPAFTGIPVFLGLLSAVILGSVVWSLRAPRRFVLPISAAVLVTTGAALRFISDELGPLTYPLLNLAFWLFELGWLVLFVGVLRFVLGPRVVLAVASVVTLGLFVVGARAITFHNAYVSVYLLLPTARQSIHGRPNAGYVHTLVAGNARILVVTSSRGDTYWAWVSSGDPKDSGILRCRGWKAPRLSFFSTSDVDQPCMAGEANPIRPRRNLVSGVNMIEFDANCDKRLRVEW